MARLETFTFRVDEEERFLLDALAENVSRTRSDALRWLIRRYFTESDLEINPIRDVQHREKFIKERMK